MLWACDKSWPQPNFQTIDLRCTNARTPLTCTLSEDPVFSFLKITLKQPAGCMGFPLYRGLYPSSVSGSKKNHMVLDERKTQSENGRVILTQESKLTTFPR